MGFRGQDFAFDSPGAAVEGMVSRVLGAGAARQSEAVALDAARGRVLAEDVCADRDSPAFDYSAMDGYAVRAAEVDAAFRRAAGAGAGAGAGGIMIAVVGESRIGAAPPVLPGSPRGGDEGACAIRIATGAAIPEGADAVVRREDVTEHAGAGLGGSAAQDARVASIWLESRVHGSGGIRAGDNIRRRGENARAGETVLAAGAVVNAASLGTLAAVGSVWPRVRPRVRVAIIITGDELVCPEATPGAYQIRNSNAAVIRGVLGAHAWIDVLASPDGAGMHTGDEEGMLDGVLEAALARADAVVVTGGVSMGHRDPVRAAVERLGGSGPGVKPEIVFHGLPQRPGKPMLGAVALRVDGGGAGDVVPVFGLPGNPVSAMVTCTRVVLPVLAALGGAVAERGTGCWGRRLVPLANPDGRRLDLWWHRLVRLTGGGEAELIDARGSGDIIAGGRSDGFIEVPPASGVGRDVPDGAKPALVPFYAWPA